MVRSRTNANYKEHRGGRIIWQLKDIERMHLYVCIINDKNKCINAEKELIEKVGSPANVAR